VANLLAYQTREQKVTEMVEALNEGQDIAPLVNQWRGVDAVKLVLLALLDKRCRMLPVNALGQLEKGTPIAPAAEMEFVAMYKQGEFSSSLTPVALLDEALQGIDNFRKDHKELEKDPNGLSDLNYTVETLLELHSRFTRAAK
jgi:hypothetical protein